ncbi:hypothetical protein C8T65DRAFT_726796 [Cerioporus squamosus]|nr:hypothetical protein C8T65DRAFT_726796 [Cerioporus squamosus]
MQSLDSATPCGEASTVVAHEEPGAEFPTPVANTLSSFFRMNGDVLLNIIIWILSNKDEDSARQGDLCALSQTCRYMRRLCMSRLFGTCTVRVKGCITLEELPPSSVWPHIKNVRFCNTRYHPELRKISSGRMIYYPKGPIKYTIKPELGGLFDPLLLDVKLRKMSNLRSVYVHGDRDGVHDISLAALKAILSLPHLRDFKMVNHEIYPCPDADGAATEPHNDRCCEGLASVTSFTYDVRMAGVPPGYPADTAQQALAAILGGLAPSLETLCLPSIYAPVETIRETHWPVLREFTLRGEHLDPPSAPYAGLFVKMPKLRALNLDIARPHIAWPTGHVAPFPWPSLEHLTLSHPSPDDAIYAHLPSSIRSVSLHSWPSQTYNVYLKLGRLSYMAWPRLSPATPPLSSAMLRVMQACSNIASHLTRLHIEYLADGKEDALLRYISTAFPALDELEIHRRRPDDMPQDPDWHLNTLGKACASLTKLRTLYVQTHLSDYPERIWIPRMAIYYVDSQHTHYAQTILVNAATALAGMLAPSVETIAFLTPDNFWPRWAIYSVHDAPDGKGRTALYEYHRLAQGGAGHCWPS